MTWRATLISVLRILFLLAAGTASAQDSNPTEYQIKSAFLFNFAKFVEWPSSAFPHTNSPIIIGIVGENPFGDILATTIRDKTVNDRPLVIKEFQPPLSTTNFHIVFISTSEKSRLPVLLQTLRESSALTVGEMERFTESGGMINFVWEGNKVRFQVNEAAAKSAGLKISSKLLSLSVRPSR
jgi:hypothetical protein